MSSHARRLRAAVEKRELVWGAGAWDVASAKIVERAGFDYVALQSFQISIRDGVPDNGMMFPNQLVDLVVRVRSAVSIPILVDFEQGFGDAYNAVHWMRELEKAGASALHIDDYDYMYKCPFIPPYLPTLRSDDDLVAQITAMAARRLNPDTVIIARSGAAICKAYADREARVSESNRRSRRYADAGADVIFGFPVDLEHLKALVEHVDKPVLMQQAITGVLPDGKVYGAGIMDLSVDELHEIGISMVTDPLTLQGVALKSMQDAANDMRKGRRTADLAGRGYNQEELEENFMDLRLVREILG